MHRRYFRPFLALMSAAVVFGGTALAADTYEIDPVHSSFLFRVKHMGVSYTYGRFDQSSGKFTMDSADPSKNSFELEVKTDSIDTGNETRDADLKSPHFFDVAKFPTMTFKSSSVKKKNNGKYEVTGDLTIHGVTKRVTTEADFVGAGKGPKGDERAGWETTLTINRGDFGMDYMLGAIGGEVTLSISLEGVKK